MLVVAALAAACLFAFAPNATRAQFTTVINSPPTFFGNNASIGSDTQLNIFAIGYTTYQFRAGEADGSSSNIEVNLLGGQIEYGFRANAGVVVNVSGGDVVSNFTAADGSEVNLSGGLIGDSFVVESGAAVSLAGNDFYLDGVPVSGLVTIGNSTTVDLTIDDQPHLLSGTLADGTPFSFFHSVDDQIATAITLQAAALPAVGPAVINVPGDPGPRSARESQTVFVGVDGAIPYNFQAGRGSTIVVNGGYVDFNFEATGSHVEIHDGFVESYFDAFTGSVVDITGGEIGWHFDAAAGSTVNISGGKINPGFTAFAGSEVQLSGGSVGDYFEANEGSNVTIHGGNFRLDGEPVEGLDAVGNSVTLDFFVDRVLSGTFADGTPFALHVQDSDYLNASSVTLQATSLPAAGPATITLPGSTAPAGVRAGQTLGVAAGGNAGDDLSAGWGSKVNVTGGQIGNNFEAAGSEVTITSGSIGQGFDALAESVVNIQGGSIGYDFDVTEDSVVNLTGGSIGTWMQALHHSVVNVAGGTIGDHLYSYQNSKVTITGGQIGSEYNLYATELILAGGQIGDSLRAHFDSVVTVTGGQIGLDADATRDSVVNIAGGSIGAHFHASGDSVVNISGGTFEGKFFAGGDDVSSSTGSTINLFGTQFILDGVDITGTLTTNLPFTVANRNVTLTGVLADGSAFDFLLGTSANGPSDYFSSTANLTVTLVDFQPGDFNRDTIVDAADYTVWRNSLGGTGDAGAGADGNFDGRITDGDYYIWKMNYGKSYGGPGGGGVGESHVTVPEPATVILTTLALLALSPRPARAFHDMRGRHLSRS